MTYVEPLMAISEDRNWKQNYTYGAYGERISMSYVPSGDTSNAWEPTPGASGANSGNALTTLYYLSDVRGSVVGLMDPEGAIAARYHYDEFGSLLQDEKFDLNYPGPDNLFGYTGLAYDYTSGLNHTRARYFDASIGRFISEDTYEGDRNDPQSLNLYTYVHNNPLRYVDPSGHFISTVTGAILGGIVGGVTAAIQGTNVMAGIAGGAVNGAIVGAAIDITLATGGGAALVIGVTMAAGAAGSAAGDYVNQVGNNLADGQSLDTAVKDVNLQSILINAGIGAASGALSGATAVVLRSFEQATHKIFSQIANNTLKSGEEKVLKNSINSVHQVAIKTGNNTAMIDYTTSVVYNAVQNTITYKVNNQVVEKINISLGTKGGSGNVMLAQDY